MRRGFTLLEIAVYIFLFMLAGLAVSTLYTLGTRARQQTVSSYLVSVEADAAIRWIRRDLQECALVSLRTWPGPDGPTEPPGCSFVSARKPTEQDASELAVNPYGAPLWTKQVYYTLVPVGPRSADLVRWERELPKAEKDNVPRPSDTMPSSVPADSKSKRVLLRTVLPPGIKIEGLDGAANYQADEHGGFSVRFIRRKGGEAGAEDLVSFNPGDTKNVTDTADNTSLVQVELKLLTSDTTRPSLYDIRFRVHPRF